ncbi:MAG TPA: nicotinate-nucleotide--dimethylbenzimidazole phosphoribosyltransferase [Rugosimonospora sp.]
MLDRTIGQIRPLDDAAMAAARDRQARLTKPPGSLGALEDLSVRLAGLAGACPPPLPEPAAVAVFAGDHGVHAQGVSPWPQEVTTQMVANFLSGGAVVNALARQVGATVTVVDVGVAATLDPLDPAPGEAQPEPGRGAGEHPQRQPGGAQPGPGFLAAGEHPRRPPALVIAKVRPGTRDLTVEPALTRAETLAAIDAGIATAEMLIDGGAGVLITGDMGIANTTPAAALIAAFTGADPAEVTGRGTGIDDETLARKTALVRAALALHRPDPADPVGVLAAVGGCEHAALAGFMLAAAARRVPVIVDGVIALSAALAAVALCPDALGTLIAGHRSVEPGASVALAHLGLEPVLSLGMRLGEGTGALLAVPVVAGAVRVLQDVATFDSAGVSEK